MKSKHRRPMLAVLRTYTSWWLTWVILVVYLGGLLSIVYQARTNLQNSKSIQGNWTGVNWESLPADLDSVESISISPIYLSEDPLKELQIPEPAGIAELARLHYAFRPDSPLRVPGKFPRLKQMVLWGSINEDQLVKLLEFQEIKSLFIVHLQPLTDRGWSALEKQPLEELEILGLDQATWQATWKESRWPATLKTLLVQDGSTILRDPTPSHLIPLLKLPNLETVKLNVWFNSDGRLRDKDVEVLANMTSLKTLYIDYFTPGTERTIQAQLPHLSVRPYYYQSSRVYWVLVMSGMGFLPLLFILHLLSLQLVTPSHSIVPRYGYHHWMGALSLLVPWFALQTVALTGIHCHWIAAVSFSAVLLIPLFPITAFFDQNGRFPGYVHFQYLFTGFMACVFLLPLLVMTWAAESDWFFMGQRYDVAMVLLILEGFSAVGLYRFFNQLNRKMAQHAEGQVPYGLFDFSTLQAGFGYPKNEAGNQWLDKLWGHGQRSRLQAALDCPGNSPHHQALMWRASQPMTAFGFSTYMTMMMVGLGGFMFLIFMTVLKLSIPQQGIGALWPILFQLVGFTLFIPAILLAQRRPFLANHLLMSCTRRDWVRLVFRQTAYDFVPFLIAMVIGLGIYAWWKPVDAWSPFHIALICLGIVGLIYGGTLYIVTLSFAGKVVFFLGIIGFLMGLGWSLVSLEDYQGIYLKEILLWPPTCWIATLGLAILGLKIAHHRWMNWELA